MTKVNFLKLTLVLPALLISTGCASITRGTSDALLVNSEPAQAHVKIYRTNGAFTAKEIKNNKMTDDNNPSSGPVVGKTPGSFKLARKGEYKVVISKAGYKTAEVQVNNRVSGAGGAGMAGNLLFGGLIGAGVDASTGAMKDLTPNPVSVSLEQGTGTTTVTLEKEESIEESSAEKEQAARKGAKPE